MGGVVAKVWLRDDAVEPFPCIPAADSGDGFGIPVVLPGDAAEAVSTTRTVQVRQREFSGYTADGDAVFGWDTVVEGPAVIREVSDEVDEFTSARTATVTILYAGDARITEGAVVVDGDTAWDVTQVRQPTGRVEMGVRTVATP